MPLLALLTVNLTAFRTEPRASRANEEVISYS